MILYFIIKDEAMAQYANLYKVNHMAQLST